MTHLPLCQQILLIGTYQEFVIGMTLQILIEPSKNIAVALISNYIKKECDHCGVAT